MSPAPFSAEWWDGWITLYLKATAPPFTDLPMLKGQLARYWLSQVPAPSPNCPCGILRAHCEYHK